MDLAISPSEKQTINDVFLYEIDGRPEGKTDRVSKAEFWDLLYEPRSDDDFFGAFLDGACDILCVSGRVGTGKSTYVRHKLEYLHDTCGVIIDCKRHRNRITEPSKSQAELLAMIGETIKETLIDYAIYHVTTKQSFGYMNHRLPISTPIKKLTYAERAVLAEYRRKAKLHLASTILSMTDLHSLAKLREGFAFLINEATTDNSDDATELLFRRCQQRLTQIDCDKIFNCMDWHDWITTLRATINAPQGIVICIDNVDALDLSNVGPHLIDTIIMVCNAVNLGPENHTSSAEEVAKFVLSIREENVLHINIDEAFSQRISQVILGLPWATIDVQERRVMPNDDIFIANVVKRRFKKLRSLTGNQSTLDAIEEMLFAYWFDSADNDNTEDEYVLKEELSRLNIVKFSNGSMRRTLFTILNSCIYLYNHFGDKATSLDDKHRRYASAVMKGSALRILGDAIDDRDVYKRLMLGLEREISSGVCCILRLTLSYLYNSDIVRYRDLETELSVFFEYSSEEVKSAFYSLYKSPRHRGELIVISQTKPIESQADIDNDATVFISERGRHFLDLIIINIDYFALFAGKGATSSPFLSMDIADAIHYIESIYSKISLLPSQYDVFLGDIAFKNMGDNGIDNPRGYFIKYYCVGGAFYSNRFMNSHMSSIYRYIAEYLRGERSALAQYYGRRSSTTEYSDHSEPRTREDLIRLVKEANDKQLDELLLLYNKYADLLSLSDHQLAGDR